MLAAHSCHNFLLNFIKSHDSLGFSFIQAHGLTIILSQRLLDSCVFDLLVREVNLDMELGIGNFTFKHYEYRSKLISACTWGIEHLLIFWENWKAFLRSLKCPCCILLANCLEVFTDVYDKIFWHWSMYLESDWTITMFCSNSGIDWGSIYDVNLWPRPACKIFFMSTRAECDTTHCLFFFSFLRSVLSYFLLGCNLEIYLLWGTFV